MMKKMTKRVMIPAMTLSLLSGGAVFANGVVTGNTAPVSVQEPAVVEPAAVNGASINGVQVETIHDIAMFPLRQVAESLGYTVTWQESDQSITLNKGAVYIRIAIGEDAYAFSRRAPQTLGSAPVLKDDCITYVPLEFVTEILGGYYRQNEDGTYQMVEPSVVTVSEVNEDGSILVYDSYLGEVVVHISDETEILAGGELALASAIEKDMVLAIEYSEAMTMSIPPQTTAVRISIENLPIDAEEDQADQETDKNAYAYAGKITEIDGNMITIGKPEEGGALCLIITEETQIKHAVNKRIYKLEDLTVGMEISGTHDEAVTRSIPGQTVAHTLQIDSEE